MTPRARALAAVVVPAIVAVPVIASAVVCRPMWFGPLYMLTPWHTTLPAFDASADVLVLGASSTARWPERSPDTYAAALGPSVANAAKPGWTTATLRRALPVETAARVVVLDAGACDLRQGASPIEAALGVAATVEVLLATTDAAVVVQAILPHTYGGDAVVGGRRAEEANAWTAALLADTDRVVFVPVDVPHDTAHYLDDGSHLSPAGYARLADALGPAVDAARGGTP